MSPIQLGVTDLIDELREYGRKGVAKAAARYDSSKGVPFQAYAQKVALLKGIPEVDEGLDHTEKQQDPQATRRQLAAALDLYPDDSPMILL